LLAGALAVAVALGLGLGLAHAADQRLDLADDALESAAALLAASQAGPVSDKTQKEFDKAVSRAIADIEEARAGIVKAQDAVDNP